jgi:hypothetical protein
MSLSNLATSPLALLSFVLMAAAAGYLVRYFRARPAGGRNRYAASGADAGALAPHAILMDAPPVQPLQGLDKGAAQAPRPKAPCSPEHRVHKRFRTCFLGTLHQSADADPDNLCDIIDLSASGARVRPVEPIPATTRIALGLRHFGVRSARIVWRRNGEVGLQFENDSREAASALRGLLPAKPAGH